MIAIVIFGVFIIIIGIMLIVAPDALYRFNQFMNTKVFNGDNTVSLHRIIAAVICIIVGAVLVGMYFYYGPLIK